MCPDEPVWPSAPAGTASPAGVGSIYNVTAAAYGAVADGRDITNASMTNGSAAITDPDGSFTQADAGAHIAVTGAGGGATILSTTILSVQSATSATLAVNAGNTTSNALCNVWKTDNGPAIRAAIAAASAAGGGAVYVPGYSASSPTNARSYYVSTAHATKTDRAIDVPMNVTFTGDGESTVIKAAPGLGAAAALLRSDSIGQPALSPTSDLNGIVLSGARVENMRLECGLGNTLLNWLCDLQGALGPWLKAYGTNVIGSGQFVRVKGLSCKSDPFSSQNVGGLRLTGACCFVDSFFAWNCQGGGLVDNGSDNNFQNVIVGACGTSFDSVRIGADSKLVLAKIYGGPTSASGFFALRLNGAGAIGSAVEIQECQGHGVNFAGDFCRFDGVVNCDGNCVTISGRYGKADFTAMSQTLGSGAYIPSNAVNWNGGTGAFVLVTCADAASSLSTGTQGNNTLLAAFQTGSVRLGPFVRALQQRINTLVYSASITPDASQGPWQPITVTDANALTINAPTNPPSSGSNTQLAIEVFNNSGGAMGAITWNAAFVFTGQAWANPATGKRRFARFEWNGTNWICTSVATADY